MRSLCSFGPAYGDVYADAVGSIPVSLWLLELKVLALDTS